MWKSFMNQHSGRAYASETTCRGFKICWLMRYFFFLPFHLHRNSQINQESKTSRLDLRQRNQHKIYKRNWARKIREPPKNLAIFNFFFKFNFWWRTDSITCRAQIYLRILLALSSAILFWSMISPVSDRISFTSGFFLVASAKRRSDSSTLPSGSTAAATASDASSRVEIFF